MSLAKCPHCDKALLHLRLESLLIHATGGKKWNGVVYSCPSCRVALSFGIDPIALKADTVAEILRALGKS